MKSTETHIVRTRMQISEVTFVTFMFHRLSTLRRNTTIAVRSYGKSADVYTISLVCLLGVFYAVSYSMER